MSEHTQGPWKWAYRTNENDENDGSIFWLKYKGHAYCIAKAPRYQSKEQWEHDAARIVSAVNAFEGMNDIPEGVSVADLLWFAQHIFNGLDTGILKIDTPADETLANVLSRGRSCIAPFVHVSDCATISNQS